jgi:hypothetical protein
MLGQQHYAEFGELRAGGCGSACTVVGMAGRHPDVEDGRVRSARADGGESTVGVDHRRDDLVAVVGEQPGESFPQQHGVLGDHDAHGSTASTVVPRPRGLKTAKAPPAALTRSLSPARPDAARTCAPPRPSSVTLTVIDWSALLTLTWTEAAAECFTALATASLAT